MQISFEEVEAIRSRLAEINSIPFSDIEWTRDGKPLSVTAKEADDWRFIGLSNACFVEFYGAEWETVIVDGGRACSGPECSGRGTR